MGRTDPKATYIDPAIAAYVMEHTTEPDQLLIDLVEETRRLAPGQMSMQIDPDQGTLLLLLARLSGARNAIEVGTFTGYSSICIARGLVPGGKLLCLDVSEEWTSVARRFWERAGLADRIELRLGPALDTLRALPETPAYDLAFIDADKAGYLEYYEEIMRRLLPGGVILVDNVLWSGRVIDPDPGDVDTRMMREFNQTVGSDPRVTCAMLPVADGLTLIMPNP